MGAWNTSPRKKRAPLTVRTRAPLEKFRKAEFLQICHGVGNMSWSYASDTRQTGFSDIRQNPHHLREHSELLRSGRKIRSRIDFALHGSACRSESLCSRVNRKRDCFANASPKPL